MSYLPFLLGGLGALEDLFGLGGLALQRPHARVLALRAEELAVGAALGTALPAVSGYIGTYEIGAVQTSVSSAQGPR